MVNSTARVVNSIASRMTHSRVNGSGSGLGTGSAINCENLPGDNDRVSYQAGQTRSGLHGGHVTNVNSGLGTRPRNGEESVSDEKQKSGNGEVPSKKT